MSHLQQLSIAFPAPPAPYVYFASGSNNAPEMRGFAAIEQPVGVAVAELGPADEAELVRVSRTRPCFVDSGAFGEVRLNKPHRCGRGRKCAAGECIGDGNLPFPSHPPFAWVTVKPIDDAQWRGVILARYRRLAEQLGAQLYVVAPDKVGDQAVTLERLARYRDEVRELRELGAHIIVPIQRGEMSQADFDRAVCRVLGFSDFVRGIPSAKAASSAEAIAAYVAEVRPARVHLLGMGPTRDTFDAYRAAATAYGAELTCDSMMILANVGKSNGRVSHPDERKGGPRVYTAAQDLARELADAGLTDMDPRELGIPIAFGPVPAGADRFEHMARSWSVRLAA